ncbi:DUF938 domain-containing protein [Brevirhabdus sp.]|uniref:DUF938 domain-containing protein n=1 Tax=Brevirhabdus sp. TaxID=2004514 RepID=UPI004059320A
MPSDRPLDLPDTAALRGVAPGGRLDAPSARRNMDPILAVLRDHAPRAGLAFEIASGTGQHVAQFAAALPHLSWQPSDLNPERLASIAAWTQDMPNVRAPIRFDAAAAPVSEAATRTATRTALAGDGETAGAVPWPTPGPNLIVLVNLLHLVTAAAARRIVTGAGAALAPGGVFILYGPFRRAGQFASAGDAQFDASLRAQDAALGYKDTDDMARWVADAGLALVERREMPANNLCYILRRPQ